MSEEYTLEDHRHRYAVWTAGRGASVKGCRFRVEKAKTILEEAGFTEAFKLPKVKPHWQLVLDMHQEWREEVILAAKKKRIAMKPAVAAKLIALYLKTRYVVGGDHRHPWVPYLHPPIDNVLLEGLADENVGGYEKDWRGLRRKGWSNLSEGDHRKAMELFRRCLNEKPMWMIEEYWQGHQ